MNHHDTSGSTLINHWQRGVPVYREPVVTTTLLFFAALAAVGSSWLRCGSSRRLVHSPE